MNFPAKIVVVDVVDDELVVHVVAVAAVVHVSVVVMFRIGQ